MRQQYSSSGVLRNSILCIALLAGWGCAVETPPAQRYERYARAMKAPWVERIVPADQVMIDHTYRTNRDSYGQDVRPRAAAADHPLAPLVPRVIGNLPESVQRLVERYLAAVYLLEEDFGSAVTESVRDREGRWRLAYVALNLTALGRKANQWATWKENSTFRRRGPVSGPVSEPFSVRVIIEEESENTLEGAIRFIFLHELGHVLGQGLGAHPSWEEKGAPPHGKKYPFVMRSWRQGAKKGWESRWKKRFPLLHKTGFYSFAEAPLWLSDAPRVYRDLSNTDFPSLYGSINRYDDFAEAFAIYVHTQLLGKPYRVEVLRKGNIGFSYRSCIQTGACPVKIAYLKELLGG